MAQFLEHTKFEAARVGVLCLTRIVAHVPTTIAIFRLGPTCFVKQELC